MDIAQDSSSLGGIGPPYLRSRASHLNSQLLSTSFHFTTSTKKTRSTLCESAGSGGGEQLLALDGAMRQREFEVLCDELLDVWAAKSVEVSDLDDLEDL
jgi:hypothetical protein